MSEAHFIDTSALIIDLYKIADTPENKYLRDNMMQVVNKKDKDTFSFFIVNRGNDILKYSVKKSLLDLIA